MRAYLELMRVRGVRVDLHWTVFLVGAFFLLGATQRPIPVLAALVSYMGVLLIHECGHMVIAQKKRCHVYSIKLYPILGLVQYDEPFSHYDHALIAWGGVLAQAMVAIPVLIWIEVFDYTHSEAWNVSLDIWGYVSIALALFNLIPVRPFDGATAWKIVPELIKKIRGKGRSSTPERNPYRWRGY